MYIETVPCGNVKKAMLNRFCGAGGFAFLLLGHRFTSRHGTMNTS
jgi:hypothetical protein